MDGESHNHNATTPEGMKVRHFSEPVKDAIHMVEMGARFGMGVVAGMGIAEAVPPPSNELPVEPQSSTGRRTLERIGRELDDEYVGIERVMSGSFLRRSGTTLVDGSQRAIGGPPHELSLLSFNAGLLDYKVLGFSVFQNPPWSGRRADHLPACIASVDADIVALQEIYCAEHAQKLIVDLGFLYPHVARRRSPDMGRLKLHNGLMVFSKYPIVHADFHPFSVKNVTNIERSFSTKGFLDVKISIAPHEKPLRVVNIHLASAAVDPNSASVELLRNHQIDDILVLIEKIIAAGELPVVMGDVNAAPESCPSNYYKFIRQGFIDAFLQGRVGVPCPNPLLWPQKTPIELSSALRHSAFWSNVPLPDAVTAGVVAAEGPYHTWDPYNVLNKHGVHSGCIGSRCDHIFITPEFAGTRSSLYQVQNSELKFKNPRVLVDNSFFEETQLVTLSDHYGVYVEFKLS